MNASLKGQVAVVAGSSRGIGRAVVRALAAAGARVVVNGRDPVPVAETVRFLEDHGATAIGVVGSAAEPETAEDLLAAGTSLGPVNIAINCAGIPEPPGSSILTIELEEWTAVLSAHLTSSFVLARAVAPGMVERGYGSIILTSSHAFTGRYGGTGYAAAKGGVNSLTYALAAELASSGVRVNAVCPGALTRLSTGATYVADIEDLHRRGLLDDLAREASLNPPPPEYVAALYTFLASDLAADVTGSVFAGAGGYLGRFVAPEERLLAYRDHATSPPWTLDEIQAAID